MKTAPTLVLFIVLLSYLITLTLAVNKEWSAFKLKYGKTYETQEEESQRLKNFKDNLRMTEKLATRSGNAHYGVTKFFDLSPTEFEQLHLMKSKMPPRSRSADTIPKPQQTEILPATWDWRTKGDVGPVENQGQCGGSWVFSLLETLASTCSIAGWSLLEFSAQQLIDCDSSNSGCSGGLPISACSYIETYGIETSSNYPYTGEDGTCTYNSKNVVPCKLYSCEYITASMNETEMQYFVYENSPIVVCVDASSWQLYTSGVITSDCGNQINHCVELVGWTVMNGIKAWILRNTWGSDWGMNGYIYVAIGFNVCGVATYPMSTCVKGPSNEIVC